MQEDEYKSDSSLLIKHVYSCDERGNRIEKKTYGSIYTSVSSLSITFSYKYDKQGNQIEKRVGESVKKPVKGMPFNINTSMIRRTIG